MHTTTILCGCSQDKKMIKKVRFFSLPKVIWKLWQMCFIYYCVDISSSMMHLWFLRSQLHIIAATPLQLRLRFLLQALWQIFLCQQSMLAPRRPVQGRRRGGRVASGREWQPHQFFRLPANQYLHEASMAHDRSALASMKSHIASVAGIHRSRTIQIWNCT